MLENTYYPFIYFIFTIKILFIIFAIIHYYLIYTHNNNTIFAKNIIYWKERLEFIFIISMSILTISLFRPYNNISIMIDYNERLLFFIYGIITCITARWNIFIHQSRWFSILQHVLGRNDVLINKIIN